MWSVNMSKPLYASSLSDQSFFKSFLIENGFTDLMHQREFMANELQRLIDIDIRSPYYKRILRINPKILITDFELKLKLFALLYGEILMPVKCILNHPLIFRVIEQNQDVNIIGDIIRPVALLCSGKRIDLEEQIKEIHTRGARINLDKDIQLQIAKKIDKIIGNKERTKVIDLEEFHVKLWEDSKVYFNQLNNTDSDVSILSEYRGNLNEIVAQLNQIKPYLSSTKYFGNNDLHQIITNSTLNTIQKKELKNYSDLFWDFTFRNINDSKYEINGKNVRLLSVNNFDINQEPHLKLLSDSIYLIDSKTRHEINKLSFTDILNFKNIDKLVQLRKSIEIIDNKKIDIGQLIKKSKEINKVLQTLDGNISYAKVALRFISSFKQVGPYISILSTPLPSIVSFSFLILNIICYGLGVYLNQKNTESDFPSLIL
jgi:hypothetical protein